MSDAAMLLLFNLLGLASIFGASLLVGFAIARAWRWIKGKEDKEAEWFIIQFWPLALGAFLFLWPMLLLSWLLKEDGGED